MEALKILALSVGAAIVYGIAHDQVTARVCVEYFTVAHPIIVDTKNPTVLALVWGVVATWWVGAILGTLLAITSRAGSWPKLTWRDQRWPLAILLIVMGVLSLLMGYVGYRMAIYNPVHLRVTAVPPERAPYFVADAWAHGTAYAAGFLGGIVLCTATLVRRAVRAVKLRRIE